MVIVFGDLIGVEDESSARLIFRSIINQKARIQIMTAMLEKAPQHADRTIFFDELIKEYKDLNGIRNAYAHGLWYTHDDGETIYLEAETEYHSFLNKTEVTLKELLGVLKRYEILQGKLLDRRRALMLAKALKASPPSKEQQPSPHRKGARKD
ncbi:MAG: hypothetical protein IPK59_17940 [Rhodospirillaceae bacterium]|nr:hypothetical protein [Rhodospirillaceae bacterium]